jgi:hypothetical protein
MTQPQIDIQTGTRVILRVILICDSGRRVGKPG